MMKIKVFLIGVLMSSLIYGQDHSKWNKLLQQYVSNEGRVDYKSWSENSNDLSILDSYIQSYSNVKSVSSKPDVEKAFWINLYNAFTVQIILKNYPVNSIMDINGGDVWNVAKVSTTGKKYTLNQIENKILRPKFKDPRIHFALNCGALSCPKLSNKAFTSENIETQLELLTKTFINNSNYNILTPDKIKVSKIFEWYISDFGGKKELANYLNGYSNTNINASAKISFLEYNWNLNKK